MKSKNPRWRRLLAWVRRHPVRTVPSYHGLPPSPGLPLVGGDADRNRQEIEKLKALGYI